MAQKSLDATENTLIELTDAVLTFIDTLKASFFYSDKLSQSLQDACTSCVVKLRVKWLLCHPVYTTQNSVNLYRNLLHTLLSDIVLTLLILSTCCNTDWPLPLPGISSPLTDRRVPPRRGSAAPACLQWGEATGREAKHVTNEAEQRSRHDHDGGTEFMLTQRNKVTN